MSQQYDDIFELDDKPKRKRKQDNYTWSDAFKSIGIFIGTLALVGVIAYSIQMILLGDEMQTYNEILGISSPGNPMLGIYDNPITTIIWMLLSLVLCTLAVFLVYGVVHLIATKALDGAGSYPGIFVVTQWWNTLSIIIYGIIGNLYSFYMVNRLVALYGENRQAIQTAQFQQDLLGLVTPYYIVMGVAWLIWAIGVSMVTAQHYQFTKVRGCVTLALSHAVFAAIYCGLSIVVGFALFSMMWNTTP